MISARKKYQLINLLNSLFKEKCVLLLMSSGTFGGINFNKAISKIEKKI